jgi:hypothetical protein
MFVNLFILFILIYENLYTKNTILYISINTINLMEIYNIFSQLNNILSTNKNKK